MENCNIYENEIGKYTTARVRIWLPSGAELSDYDDIVLTGAQGGEVAFQKHIDDIVEDGTLYYFAVTLNDTQGLNEFAALDMQIWWQSGTSAGSTKVMHVPVRELVGGVPDEGT